MTGYIGEVAKVRREGRMLLNQRVGKFRIKESSRLDADFLFYCLRNPELKAQLAAHTYGAAQPNISPTLIEQQEIPLPPLPIQRRIAGILSAYDDLIENSQRRIKILEEMTRRLYREWFVHFRFPGHEGCRFVDSPLGEIPEGWELLRLGDIAEEMRRNVIKGSRTNRFLMLVLSTFRAARLHLITGKQLPTLNPINWNSRKVKFFSVRSGRIFTRLASLHSMACAPLIPSSSVRADRSITPSWLHAFPVTTSSPMPPQLRTVPRCLEQTGAL